MSNRREDMLIQERDRGASHPKFLAIAKVDELFGLAVVAFETVTEHCPPSIPDGGIFHRAQPFAQTLTFRTKDRAPTSELYNVARKSVLKLQSEDVHPRSRC
jgi:hypothetical protein